MLGQIDVLLVYISLRYFQHAQCIPLVDVGKRGFIVTCQGALVRNYVEVYWPCAGGLSAVNAIGTQLRDPIDSGLTRRRVTV